MFLETTYVMNKAMINDKYLKLQTFQHIIECKIDAINLRKP